jgi:predicted nucleotidyltransferase component of viral defense system
MNPFLIIDGSALPQDPSSLLSSEFRGKLAGPENAPNLFAEFCVLDMMSAIAAARPEPYYIERLILKGGHAVRSYVPLTAHRFSYDLDFNVDRDSGYKLRGVKDIRTDLNNLAIRRRSAVRADVARDLGIFYWIEMNYRDTIRNTYGVTIPEVPKIEICKSCRTFLPTVRSRIPTMFDLNLIGLTLPEMKQLDLDELLANKLYVIGIDARQRRHFDIFDSYRIYSNNRTTIHWPRVRSAFGCYLRKISAKEFVRRATELIHKTEENVNTASRIESATFETFAFKAAAEEVVGIYSKLI